MTACSVQPITERRTSRNLDTIEKMTPGIIAVGVPRFTVDSLENRSLRKQLRRVNAKTVEIFWKPHHELRQDSLIILSRHNFMLTFGEIVIDLKRNGRGLEGVGGLKKIGNRTYFRLKSFAIS